MRAKVRKTRGIAKTGDGRIKQKILSALPFSLTSSQVQAVSEIERDLAAPERMLRLLQGDVGAGKTVVGLLAMARGAEAGFQSALMAPTEILARQHMKTVAPLAEAAGLRAAILTGREKVVNAEKFWKGCKAATFTSSSALMRCFRKACSLKNSVSSLLTSSIVSAFTSVLPSPPRARRPTFLQ